MDGEIYKFEDIPSMQISYLYMVSSNLSAKGSIVEELVTKILNMNRPLDFMEYHQINELLKQFPAIDEVMYMNAVCMNSLQNKKEDINEDTEDTIETFSTAMKTSLECIKALDSQIDWLEFLFNTYTNNELSYDEYDQGTHRVYYLSNSKDVTLDITYTKTEFIIWHSKSEYPLIIPIPQFDDVELDSNEISEFRVPRALDWYVAFLIGMLDTNGIVLSNILKISLQKFFVTWFFRERVHANRRYFNKLVDKYFNLLSFHIYNKEDKEFHEDNGEFHDLCYNGKYPKLYNSVHEKLKNSLGGNDISDIYNR